VTIAEATWVQQNTTCPTASEGKSISAIAENQRCMKVLCPLRGRREQDGISDSWTSKAGVSREVPLHPFHLTWLALPVNVRTDMCLDGPAVYIPSPHP
jgi:hypothetical protein